MMRYDVKERKWDKNTRHFNSNMARRSDCLTLCVLCAMVTALSVVKLAGRCLKVCLWISSYLIACRCSEKSSNFHVLEIRLSYMWGHWTSATWTLVKCHKKEFAFKSGDLQPISLWTFKSNNTKHNANSPSTPVNICATRTEFKIALRYNLSQRENKSWLQVIRTTLN